MMIEGRPWLWAVGETGAVRVLSGLTVPARIRGDLRVQCHRHPLRLQPSGPKPKWLTSQCSQCWPVMPGWHSHWPVRMSHCPLVEPRAWQSHLKWIQDISQVKKKTHKKTQTWSKLLFFPFQHKTDIIYNRKQNVEDYWAPEVQVIFRNSIRNFFS